MSIKIDEGTEVRTIWTVEMATGNVMGMLLRQPSEDWAVIYRFRWYVDKKVFDSSDRRSWYRIAAEPGHASNPDKLDAMFTETMREAAQRAPGGAAHVRRYEVNAVGPAAMETIKTIPMFNVRLEQAP
jgi:hypothetical protein